MKRVHYPLLAGALLGWAVASAAGAQADAAKSPPAASVARTVADILDIFRQYGFNVDDRAAERAVATALVTIADPQGRLLDPSTAPDQADLIYDPGLRLVMTGGLPRVSAVDSNSPAAAAALPIGVMLESIDGVALLSGHDPAVAEELLRGTNTAPVRLVWRDDTGATGAVAIARAPRQLPAIQTAEELPHNLGYLRLNGLYPESGHDVVQTLRGWAATGHFGLVLDLRGAGGRDLSAAEAIASLFSDSHTLLFALRDAGDRTLQEFKAHPGTPLGMPTMVLVDHRTTGAAEVLAAALQASVRGAMLVGAETAGDPAVREAIALPSGLAFYIATRRLVLPGNIVYDGRAGVRPDLIVPDVPPADADYEPELPPAGKVISDEEKEDRRLRERVRGDITLQRAVDVLLGLKALNIRATGTAEHSNP